MWDPPSVVGVEPSVVLDLLHPLVNFLKVKFIKSKAKDSLHTLSVRNLPEQMSNFWTVRFLNRMQTDFWFSTHHYCHPTCKYDLEIPWKIFSEADSPLCAHRCHIGFLMVRAGWRRQCAIRNRAWSCETWSTKVDIQLSQYINVKLRGFI